MVGMLEAVRKAVPAFAKPRSSLKSVSQILLGGTELGS